MKTLLGIGMVLCVGATPPHDVVPEGVCAIDDRGVVCWDVQGKSLPELTRRIEREVRASNRPLGFILGRKNRYLVVRSEEGGSISSDSVGFGPITVGEGEEARSLIRVAAHPDAADATIDLKTAEYVGAAKNVAFREGVKTTVDGVRFEIGPIERMANSPFASTGRPTGSPTRSWRYAIDSDRTDPLSSVASVPLDGEGNPIRLIDADGKPIPYGMIDPRNQDLEKLLTSDSIPKAFYAAFGSTWAMYSFADYGGLWQTTNIDPRWVRSVRLAHRVIRRERIGPFALDPAKS